MSRISPAPLRRRVSRRVPRVNLLSLRADINAAPASCERGGEGPAAESTVLWSNVRGTAALYEAKSRVSLGGQGKDSQEDKRIFKILSQFVASRVLVDRLFRRRGTVLLAITRNSHGCGAATVAVCGPSTGACIEQLK